MVDQKAAEKNMVQEPGLKEQGFYHWSAWRRIRQLALQRDHYLCQNCLKKGVIKTATEVHHLQPVADHPELALELSNLQSLCWQCHEQTKHQRHGSTAPEIPKGVRVIKA